MSELTKPVLAATAWPSNADLIESIAQLGYLKRSDHILDPTYGAGVWWKKWQPDRLTRGLGDFRFMPYRSAVFDAVAFDPPYVCAGGRTSTTVHAFMDRYGMTGAPTTTRGVQANINAGLGESYRVVRPGGIVLVKCQDYISSSKLWLGTHYTLSRALDLGFFVVDRLEHVGNPRPQPHRDGPQQHARRNLSTLFVLRRPKR